MIRRFNTKEEPITDPYVALYHLGSVTHYKADAAVLFHPRLDYIVERSFVGGAYDMEIVRKDVWYLAGNVPREMIDRGWLNLGTPHWGYTDRFERRITEKGRSDLLEWEKRLANSVEVFLKL